MFKQFPAIRPYSKQFIAVTAPHQLYIEESGNPDGIPVLFIHGGPGGGTSKTDRCFFDPEKYRINNLSPELDLLSNKEMRSQFSEGAEFS